jgi:2-phospho-L-lactate guanylyltransferase (CobY/MobA/RfbA family)
MKSKIQKLKERKILVDNMLIDTVRYLKQLEIEVNSPDATNEDIWRYEETVKYIVNLTKEKKSIDNRIETIESQI